MRATPATRSCNAGDPSRNPTVMTDPTGHLDSFNKAAFVRLLTFGTHAKHQRPLPVAAASVADFVAIDFAIDFAIAPLRTLDHFGVHGHATEFRRRM